MGDPLSAEPDETKASNLLAFASIESPSFYLYPIASHIAEKKTELTSEEFAGHRSFGERWRA